MEVQAAVCAQCSDAWIDDPVAAKLESIMAEARRQHGLHRCRHLDGRQGLRQPIGARLAHLPVCLPARCAQA
jgi:hypothetical protein